MNGALAIVPTGEIPPCELNAGNRWCAHLAQLLVVPPAVPVTLPVSPYLKLATKRSVVKRTWIASASPAAVFLLHRPTGSVLVVSLKGNIHEEHYVSNLHFCWPQICCQGSRLVFASYRDHTDEVQKFGLRFFTAFDAQSFLDSLKECSKIDEIASNDCGEGSDMQSVTQHSQLSIPTGPSYRGEDGSSFASQTDVYYPHISPSAVKYQQHTSPTTHAVDGLEPIFGRIPPSFSELLNAYCTSSTNVSDTPNPFFPRLNDDIPDARLTPTPTVEAVSITDYMKDPSFQDALQRVEEIWGAVESLYRTQ